MTLMGRTETRGAEIAKLLSDPAQILALRTHLQELVSGETFRASPRSQQFLQYIVEKSIRGDFESLKERMIGIELFGRPASFDTGEDSIVRVTASDVRKRLHQHYGWHGHESALRLSIPSGSYIPEITWNPPPVSAAPASISPQPDPVETPESHPVENVEQKDEESAPNKFRLSAIGFSVRVNLFSILAIILVLALTFGLGLYVQKQRTLSVKQSILPWSALLHPGRTLQIVTSDPDFAAEQEITNQAGSLADYSKGIYVPENAGISPELRDFSNWYLRGNKAADIDIRIVSDITRLAQATSTPIQIRSARSLQLSDFHTDDDFVLLGNPLSNPWAARFNDQLDFRFILGKDSRPYSIENIRPQGKEPARYSPKDPQFVPKQPSTGTDFAIVAFVGNPNQSGQVLLIAGTGPAGTEAAAQLSTNVPKLTQVLRGCDVQPGAQLHHFEILLKVDVVISSLSSADVIACHKLPDGKS
jgi:hypothetical protein